MEAQLRRLGPNSKVKVLKTPKECRTKIWLAGRGTSCQIYTKSKYASRQHFSITYREQKYFISDLQSANGTFLNNEKLVSEKALSFGSIISVGVPSEMQNSPDCIVYVFESYPGVIPIGKQSDKLENGIETVVEITEEQERSRKPEPDPPVESIISMDVDPPPEQNKEKLDKGMVNIDVEKTVLNDSSSSEVVFIEATKVPEKHLDDSNEPQPAKKRKLEEKPVEIIQKRVGSPERIELKNEEDTKGKEMEDEDIFAYEALTQVDEPQVKPEPDFLNYSQTEELIEISDSEDDWSPSLKQEGNKSPDGGDEDDDVVILETIIKEPRKIELPPVICKVEDDLTETDKKWMGRLLKIEKDAELSAENARFIESTKTGDKRPDVTEAAEMVGEDEIEEVDSSIGKSEINIAPCQVRLSRLSVEEIRDQVSEPPPEVFPRTETPQKIAKQVAAKKTVSFNLVPQIKYFEVPSRTRLTPSEVGRMRFTRIIFNICNWNTHWLEECKRVAPEKVPPDICEERLRKIPKKFPSHSDYMKAFIPAMLHHLWNKIRDKWVASGESGFRPNTSAPGVTGRNVMGRRSVNMWVRKKLTPMLNTCVHQGFFAGSGHSGVTNGFSFAFRQTVSCDSCEDYHAENLSVYKCTGLVQSVDGHKQLLREGHLVLLRLHQIQLPQFTTPAAEKYSKKLGYLVFGFVESKIYERFHNQKLHQALAERCASVLGDLHIVRLRILVKKRPSFQIDKQKLIQLTVVHQISQEIRLFRGICFLPDSPLCASILKPPKVEPPLAEPPKNDLIFKGPVDDTQGQIVRKLSHACSTTSSFFHSIIGAAGTGKGQLIIALILQLLFGEEWTSKRPKIIYCTQWSIPLDEMVLKLKNCRQACDAPFSLVRVGPIREVKPEVRDLCVSNLANSRRNANKRDLDSRKFDAEIEVIKEADVICTTCISAGIAKMCSAFEKLSARDRDRKVICIIDEAMSCREPESVVPLLLGVTHLILVGDIYQLEPTFSGEKTYSLGFDMSLFWRVYKNFVSIPDKDVWPVFILKTQYRMYSSLSKFTGQLIYNTRLQKPVPVLRTRISTIRSHLLLIDQAPGHAAKAEKENREIRITSQLTKAITRLVKAATKEAVRIAVIMCDTRQTEAVQSLLPKGEFPEVEIDKIQAFQGREFDVVLFAYDGRKILTSWLATALTRARNSLFIFASEQSIKGNPWFKKMADSAEKYCFLRYINPDMSMKEFEEVVSAA